MYYSCSWLKLCLLFLKLWTQIPNFSPIPQTSYFQVKMKLSTHKHSILLKNQTFPSDMMTHDTSPQKHIHYNITHWWDEFKTILQKAVICKWFPPFFHSIVCVSYRNRSTDYCNQHLFFTKWKHSETGKYESIGCIFFLFHLLCNS